MQSTQHGDVTKRDEGAPLTFSSTLVENLCDIYRFIGALPTSRMRNDELLCVVTGMPFADINFACLRYAPAEKELSTIVTEALDFFKIDNSEFYWWLTPGEHNARLADCLVQHGFQMTWEAPTMAADLRTITPLSNPPPGYRFVDVSNAKEMEVWADVSFRGFSLPPDTRDSFMRMIGHFLDLSVPNRPFYYMVYEGDRPMAASMLSLSADVAGLYWVCTLPEARHKGWGTAIVVDTLLAAKKRGYVFACLQSTDMGYNLYRKLGFKEYFRIPLYVRKQVPPTTAG